MVINVCIGSACHLKGSYDVIGKLKEKIASSGLDNKIELKASFCLDRCSGGVTMKVDDEFIEGVYPETIDEIFDTQILPKVN